MAALRVALPVFLALLRALDAAFFDLVEASLAARLVRLPAVSFSALATAALMALAVAGPTPLISSRSSSEALSMLSSVG